MVGYSSRKGHLDSILAHCTSLAPLDFGAINSNRNPEQFSEGIFSLLDVVSILIEQKFLFLDATNSLYGAHSYQLRN